MSAIQQDTMVHRNADVLTGIVDDTVMMTSVESGRYFELNETGAAIWTALEEPRSIRELCEAVSRTHHIEPIEAFTFVVAFVEKLHHRGLVRLA